MLLMLIVRMGISLHPDLLGIATEVIHIKSAGDASSMLHFLRASVITKTCSS